MWCGDVGDWEVDPTVLHPKARPFSGEVHKYRLCADGLEGWLVWLTLRLD